MSECKYCQKTHRQKLASITDVAEIKKERTIGSVLSVNHITGRVGIPINYCLMCGRRLGDE